MYVCCECFSFFFLRPLTHGVAVVFLCVSVHTHTHACVHAHTHTHVKCFLILYFVGHLVSNIRTCICMYSMYMYVCRYSTYIRVHVHIRLSYCTMSTYFSAVFIYGIYGTYICWPFLNTHLSAIFPHTVTYISSLLHREVHKDLI